MRKLYYSAAENIQKLANKESWIKWGQSPPEMSIMERVKYYEKIGANYLVWRINKGRSPLF